jgi:hypothetical protein
VIVLRFRFIRVMLRVSVSVRFRVTNMVRVRSVFSVIRIRVQAPYVYGYSYC